MTVKTTARALWYWAVIGAALDALTTWLALSIWGADLERSPVIAAAVDAVGIGPALFGKAAVAAFVSWTIARRVAGVECRFTPWLRVQKVTLALIRLMAYPLLFAYARTRAGWWLEARAQRSAQHSVVQVVVRPVRWVRCQLRWVGERSAAFSLGFIVATHGFAVGNNYHSIMMRLAEGT